MLSRENNELICRVGPGTPMGELMRQYWIPALPSAEFLEPDGPPKRMRLLGENLVMFRDSSGRMGALEESCPHRGASLYFGRNEEGGLRCAYHGWKFDRTGKCLDTPTEAPERQQSFCAKIKARAFPCHEVNHMIWVYMGSRDTPPPFPQFEINTLPPDHVQIPRIMGEEANYLQNMEGDLDSAHLDWVHRRLNEDSPKPEKGIRGFWNPTKRPPILDVVPTEYGAYYSAKRILGDGSEWHRVNQFIFPFHTMITTGDGTINLRSFVPVDDEFTMLISQTGSPLGPISDNIKGGDEFWEEVGGYVDRTNDPKTYFLTKANRSNDYGRDLKVQSETMFCGIPFVGNLQDRAMTELMTNEKGEPIYDRTKEHLSASDAMIVTVRRQLLNAASRLRDEGIAPPNVEDVSLDKVRSASLRLEGGTEWKARSAEARQVQEGKAAAAEVPLIV
ncbi:Rieske 2Fe-2S domain-containing protein [Rhodopseudomonas sp.]|uniref:Rieske 2Fe-2S domain-containing protein n=1 Tax=Rhodopseudomonas sp. TaxID=1078 RepID=UPI003B3A050D